MSQGQWITVPANQTRSGRVERRFRMNSGQIRETEPGLGYLQAQFAGVGAALSGLPRYTAELSRQLGAPGLAATQGLAQASGSGDWRARVQNEPLSSAQLGALREGQNQAIRAYGAAPAAPVLPPPAGLSDDVDARASERRRMEQQYAPQNYWATETGKAMAEAARTGPRSGEAGYAQRADIAAWMEAMNKTESGQKMVSRFLEQQRAKGLLEAPDAMVAMATGGGDQLRVPTDSDSAAQAVASQAPWADPALKGQTPLSAAQADIAAHQSRSNEAMMAGAFGSQGALAGVDPRLNSEIAAGFRQGADSSLDSALAYGTQLPGNLTVAQRPMEAEQVRQQAMGPVAQANPAQALSTGTGSGPALQPTSALASEAGVEPSQADAPGNRPNPADDFLRERVDRLRQRAAVLGY